MLRDIKVFQRHELLRAYGKNGHVLPICIRASNHITALLDMVEMQQAKLNDCKNRLETIRETNPEISLDHDLELISATLDACA